MRTTLAITTALALTLYCAQVSAQKDDQGSKSEQKDSGRAQGQTETIRGELAGASGVGEAMGD